MLTSNPARPNVGKGRIVHVARPSGFGVLQPFQRQVFPLAERQVVAELGRPSASDARPALIDQLNPPPVPDDGGGFAVMTIPGCITVIGDAFHGQPSDGLGVSQSGHMALVQMPPMVSRDAHMHDECTEYF
ncbi:hypothetical protein [Burkholderia sp. Bp9143]|uniref:hypothetical protein n=1 Tax=Burkholderia sp. Bp9143 TaxID=2184574 RepID=UPI000F59953A|nr:hypothetical protein [Burkholderia sp. Bp9143]